MTILHDTKPSSQTLADNSEQVAARAGIYPPWCEEGPQVVLPCQGLPLYQAECSCGSAGLVLATIAGVRECPMQYPNGCPFRKAPTQ